MTDDVADTTPLETIAPELARVRRLSRMQQVLGWVAIALLVTTNVAILTAVFLVLDKQTETARDERRRQLDALQGITAVLDDMQRADGARERNAARGAEAVAQFVAETREGNRTSRENQRLLRELVARPQPTPAPAPPPSPGPTASPRPSATPQPSRAPSPSPSPGPTPSPSAAPVDPDDLVCGLTGDCSETQGADPLLPIVPFALVSASRR